MKRYLSILSAVILAAATGITFAGAPAGAPAGGAPGAAPAGAPGGAGGGRGARGGAGGGGFGGAPAAGAPGAGAPAGAAPAGGGRGARGGGAPANLGGAMRDMAAMITALKTDAADPAKSEAVLKSLVQFERDVAIAKMQTPPVERAAEADRAKAAEEYRKAMTTLQRTALDLEDAVIAKKADDIKKLITKLEDTQKAGHTLFKVGG